MNIYILNVLNKDNLTQEQLKDNTAAARVAYTTHVADARAYAAFLATYTAATAAYVDTDTAYWLDEYFKLTGETRSDYEAELLRDNSFREVS